MRLRSLPSFNFGSSGGVFFREDWFVGPADFQTRVLRSLWASFLRTPVGEVG
jgi:hypothetical protein